jgi:cold-inducible RNA-binding protein
MFTKLFVGGLPFQYSNDELRALFAPVGAVVSAEMVIDPDRGRTRGFGFVQMGTPELAQAAIAQRNGFPVGEKKIFVTEAREKPAPRPSPPRRDFPQIPNRKIGRPDQSPRQNPATDPGAPRPANADRSHWPYGRKYSAGSNPTRPFSFDDNRPARRSFSEGGPVRRKFGEGGPARRKFGEGGPAPRKFGEGGPAPRSFGEGGHARRYKGSRGRGPANGPTPPASGPKGASGFSRPNKWEPRGDEKRAFGAPRREKGNFGPTRRGDGRRPANPGSGAGGKPKFWQKFAKKNPRPPTA